MTTWQYFYIVSGSVRPESTPRALGRTDLDGPSFNAQTLGRELRWVDSEYLLRYHLRGTNEDDYVEISEDRAIEIIEHWVASGHMPRWPDEPRRSNP
jgi:hypothetical protein